jgi:NAD-dependent dihydropyrimidine dehydrogenase PreA subunit
MIMSSNVICYFSGTGNSYSVARKIADAVGDCRIYRITKKMLDDSFKIDADRFGLVYPVHSYGPPAMVRVFISKCTIQKAAYTFSVAVHDGKPENAPGVINSLMKQRGREIDGFFSIRMPGNFIVGKEKESNAQIRIIRESDKIIIPIIEDICARDYYPVAPVPLMNKIIKTGFISKLFSKLLLKFDKNFIQTSRCVQCGICVNVCPSENIVLANGKKLIFKNNCQACMACLNWCPNRAILYRDRRPRNYYKNPSVKVTDLL